MGFRWPRMPGTGQTAVWQGVSNIGQAGGDLGEVFNEQQAQVDFEAFKIEFEGEIDKLGDSISKNQDENTYLAETNKVITGTNSYMPKNGLAKRFASSFVNQRTPQLRDDAKSAMKLRVKDKWQAGLITEEDRAVKSGNAIDYLTYIGAGLVNNSITEAAAAKAVSDTRNKMEYEAGLQWGRTNPTELLEASQDAETVDGQVQLGGFVTLSEGQIIALRANAEGWENFNKRRGLDTKTQFRTKMGEAAQDFTISPGEQFATIQKLELPADEENALFEEFTDARESIVKGLGSPYDTTMNPSRLKDMRDAARAKTLTLEQISAAEGKTDGISMKDAEDLRKRLAGGGTAQNFRDGSMATTFLALMKSEGFDPRGIEEQQGLRWLEDWSINNPNATQREADEQAFRVAERVRREDDEGTLPTTAAQLEAARIGPGGVVLKGMEELDKIDLSKIPVTVRNQVDYDKLPSGTVFRDENGKRFRKP